MVVFELTSHGNHLRFGKTTTCEADDVGHVQPLFPLTVRTPFSTLYVNREESIVARPEQFNCVRMLLFGNHTPFLPRLCTISTRTSRIPSGISPILRPKGQGVCDCGRLDLSRVPLPRQSFVLPRLWSLLSSSLSVSDSDSSVLLLWPDAGAFLAEKEHRPDGAR